MNQFLKHLGNTAVNWAKGNATTILTGVASGGVVLTAISAANASIIAKEMIENDSYEAHGDRYAYTKKEALKSSWTCWIAPTLIGTGTIFCIVGANSVHTRKNAAIASLLTISESALKEYQEKVIETIGEKKEQRIHDELVQERLDRDPLGKKEVIITGSGETLCYETLSGRYFKSDRENLRKIANDIGHDLLNDMYVSLNEVYSKMGLKPTKLGDQVGWNVDKAFEFSFSTMLAEGGQPCLVIDYDIDPSPTFRK